MKKKRNLIFEKAITRDWSLLFTEMWHEAYIKQCRKAFGGALTEAVYEYTDRAITAYRSSAEVKKLFLDRVLRSISENPRWMDLQTAHARYRASSLAKLITKINSESIDRYPARQLCALLVRFYNAALSFAPYYVLMFLFPLLSDNCILRGHEVSARETAQRTRKKLEKIEPFIDRTFERLASEVLRRARISQRFARLVSYGELKDFLVKGSEIDKKLLQRRVSHFIVTNDGVLQRPLRTYLTLRGFSLRVKKTALVRFFRGQIAFLGIARGTVKIVRGHADLARIKQGDVLVTAMTAPDFVPALKKAAAFITDEGGITCHAAIIARELKKPCIIGTKIATQVLKDGDLVEVDAGKGTIKILKKRERQ